jgi:RNA polymerase sigma-70 factor (ECF subfamily)
MRKDPIGIDPELVVGLNNNSEKAFRQIFDLLGNKVYNYCRKVAGNPQEAEELLQDIFFKVWQFRARIDSRENFEILLFTIARNHLLNHLRKKTGVSVVSTVEASGSVSGQQDLSDQLAPVVYFPSEFQEIYQQYRKVLDSLGSRTKEIFELSRDYEFTNKQIAEHFVISTKAVEFHITKALKIIRNKLDKA